MPYVPPFGYKNNSHCQTAVTVVQYSLSKAYTVSVTAIQCICVPLGISVPGGFFILNHREILGS
nr:MAG TPA: hypothetical protein [Caudoviricetes sp.]